MRINRISKINKNRSYNVRIMSKQAIQSINERFLPLNRYKYVFIFYVSGLVYTAQSLSSTFRRTVRAAL